MSLFAYCKVALWEWEGVGRKMRLEKGRKHFVCDALGELKTIQDSIIDFHSKYFGQLLLKIVGSDTIPFFLIMNNGMHLRLMDKEKKIETAYFRIETVDQDYCRATITLLRALDYEGKETTTIADVVSLEKTSIKKTIELGNVTAIQLLNTDLLGAKIIIEPKW